MFQNIGDLEYKLQYRNDRPKADDYLLIFKNEKVLTICDGEKISLPFFSDIGQEKLSGLPDPLFLFSISEKSFFLSMASFEESERFQFKSIRLFRNISPGWMAFAAATGYHLYKWYKNNVYCGACGTPMSHKGNERALFCTHCGNIVYPCIAPVIIVGITKDDEILLTRYAAGYYRRYALVAGFVEIGENLEDAVRREIMEEVGLNVKNIRYYDSQPWGYSQSVLAGFFAEADGDTQIILDENELSEAVWVKREDVPLDEKEFSLTGKMMNAFRNGEEKNSRK